MHLKKKSIYIKVNVCLSISLFVCNNTSTVFTLLHNNIYSTYFRKKLYILF
jgi:hypothetical protein